ncbi:hypothetical protein EB118_12765 [bacterium]|nr:hypothetical protein [bacterium]NDG30932.1 hypothetical protein [bacterium]
MSKNHVATSFKSGYGIKPVQIDGVTVATVLKFAVKRHSLLHIAYWAAFDMHDFNGRPKLYLEQQEVCKNRSSIRLYCMAQFGQHLDLWAIYRRAQILVREAEIAELQGQPSPEWVNTYWEKNYPIREATGLADDDLPF